MRIIKLTTYLLSMILALAIANQVSAATEFISVIDTDGSSGDYSTLSSWEQYNQCDLLTSRVLSHGGITGTIADDSFVKGATSGAYGTVIHVTSTQIAIETITGTFQNNEQIDKTDTLDGAISSPAANVTSSSAPDSIISVASCQATTGVADQTAVTIEGWTTSDTNYIKIYTTTANRHDGKWNTGKYRLAPTSGSRMIWNKQNYTEIEGLQILARNVDWNEGIRSDNTGIKVSYCLIKGQANSYIGINNQGSGSNYIWNNIVYDFENTSQPGQGIRGIGGGPVYVYNNTIVNCNRGLNTSYDNTLTKNNLVYGCADSYNDIFKSGSDYNSTERDEDMSIVGGGGTNNRKNQTFTFVDENASPPDYHLASNDVGAKDHGVSDPGSGLFSDDIDGQTRDQNSNGWDIGADEAAEKIYRSVGPSATTALETGTGNDLNISGSTATFTTDLGTDVGVGDAIQYDTAGAAADPIDAICFIHGRTDETHYTVKNSLGGAPTATVADQDWSIFRAYDSLSHAESGDENDAIDNTVETFENWANGKDIVTSNEQWNIACYANGTTADQTAVTINDWTTGANNYIKVYTPTEITEVGESQRHGGKWDDTKYRIGRSTSNPIIRIYEANVRIEGLQVYNSLINGFGIRIESTADRPGEWHFYENILKNTEANPTGRGLYDDDTIASDKYYIKNNIIYDWYNGIDISRDSPAAAYEAYIYSNTVCDCVTMGIRINRCDGILRLKNNLVQNSGNSDYNLANFGGSVTTEYVDNLSEDATSPNNEHDSKAVVFVDETGDDFHLASIDTNAKDAGTDLSSDSYLSFSDDIDSDSRPSPYWDIGADEYPAKQKAKFKGEFRFKGEVKFK